jgi:hypothetical protein
MRPPQTYTHAKSLRRREATVSKACGKALARLPRDPGRSEHGHLGDPAMPMQFLSRAQNNSREATQTFGVEVTTPKSGVRRTSRQPRLAQEGDDVEGNAVLALELGRDA